MNFDTIIIDSAEALNRIEPFTRYRFSRGIKKALSPEGVLVLPDELLVK